MTEHDLRRRIYALELKPNTKLTLLGVLDIVNWQTWQSQCSSKDVGRRMTMKETSVRRAFSELVKLGFISRVAERRTTEGGKVHHHRAVTRLNVRAIMGSQTLAHNELTPLAHKEPPLAHSELTPLAHSELTPTLIMSYNTTEGTTEDNNRETTEDTQQASQPVQDAEASAVGLAVEVNDDEIPPELSDLTEYQMSIVREHAADHQCSLLEANAHFERIRRNTEKKLEWRRKNESKMNRPTTAYRPKPLY